MLIEIEHFGDGLVHSRHECRGEFGQGAFDKPAIVDRAQLVDEQVGCAAEAAGCMNTNTQGFGPVDQDGRQRNDEGCWASSRACA